MWHVKAKKCFFNQKFYNKFKKEKNLAGEEWDCFTFLLREHLNNFFLRLT